MTHIDMRKFVPVFIFCLLWLCTVRGDNVIDEVIWVVGDEPILRSEVEEERLRAQYEGQRIDGDPYCVIPEQIALQKLFLHQAELDSVVVNESSVTHQVEMRMNYYLSQIGSKEKMEEYFRKTSSEIREELMTTVRNQMIIQQLQSHLTENIKPTPGEIRRFYQSLPPDSIPVIPAQVEVQILSFAPPVPREEKERTKARLRDYAERVNNGTADFAMLARLYSEDTESAKQGGELGLLGRGQLVTPFADVAFNLTTPGKVSRIVETEYGYHIIQLIEKKGERINCRHILLRPHVTAEDKINALTKLDSVATLIRLDSLTFEKAVVLFSEDKNTAMNAGLMINPQTGAPQFEYQDLPPEIAKRVYNMQEGEMSEAFMMMDEASNKELCVLVKIRKKSDTHRAQLPDDFQVIRGMLEQKLSNEFIHDWIIKKQKETYIQISDEWRGCDFLYPGWIH